jgi:hypothetical protein
VNANIRIRNSFVARALRELLARSRNPHLQRPTINMQKFIYQNSVMVVGTKLWASQNIFAGLLNNLFFQIWSYPRHMPRHNPMVAAPDAGLAGMPMGEQA